MEPFRFYDPDGTGKPAAGLYTKEQVDVMLRRALPGIAVSNKPRAGPDWIARNTVSEYRHLAEQNITNMVKGLK